MILTDIFYADDDQDDLLLFKDAFQKVVLLQNTEVSLHSFDNGIDLLETIKTKIKNSSVIILDINMPKKSGFDILKEIRIDDHLNNFPIIMYSTSYDKSSIEMSYKLGANFYIVKPYNFQDLIEMIDFVVNTNWTERTVDFNNFQYKKNSK